MKILMLNDYMDSPDAHWRGAQVQTRRLAKALDATVNGRQGNDYPPPNKWEAVCIYPKGGWDVVNYQDIRSLTHKLLTTGRVPRIKVATVRWHDPVPDIVTLNRLNEMDGIVAISHYVKDEMIKRGVQSEKIRVIPSCVEPFEMPLDYMKRQSFTIIFAGAIEKRKGIETLLEAMKLMVPYESTYWIPRVNLKIIGVGRDLDWMEKEAGGLSTWFHGLMSIDRLRIAIKSSDVLVLPSIQEAFGSVLLEAMMVETPIVASDVGGISEVVQHGRDGTLVQPGDSEELAKQLFIMAHCQFLTFEDMVEAAKQKALKYYTVDRVARLTKEYYQELLDAKEKL